MENSFYNQKQIIRIIKEQTQIIIKDPIQNFKLLKNKKNIGKQLRCIYNLSNNLLIIPQIMRQILLKYFFFINND